jgi:hypothetical protein
MSWQELIWRLLEALGKRNAVISNFKVTIEHQTFVGG